MWEEQNPLMNTTHRGSGPSRRVVITGVAALAAAALPAGVGIAHAAPATPSSASPASSSASSASIPSGSATARPSAASARGLYAAVVARGSTRTLVLADQRTGKVVRTLASARATDMVEPFVDVDVAPDGSVWAVVRAAAKDRYLPYASSLKHYVGGRTVNVLPYVTSVRLSPNGHQLAITVLSPDGNKDGKGTQALRIATTAGRVLRTLSSVSFPVGKDGNPTVEIGGQRVAGWLTDRTLVVGDGCCDSGSVSLVSAVAPSKAARWPTFSGTGSTRAIGTIGTGTVLVGDRLDVGDGQKVPFATIGVRALTMTAARPKGRQVAQVLDDSGDLTPYIDRFVARAKARPLAIGPKRFPYQGTGTVRAAYL